MNRSSRKAFILIVILVLITLLTFIVIGLLLSVRGDSILSRYHTSGDRSLYLADGVSEFIIAQIQRGINEGDGWASQPGLIRSFSSENGEKAFKLYSSDKMVVNGLLKSSEEESLLKNWSNQPALFTDLNEPYYNSISNKKYYPIIDPGCIDKNLEPGSVRPNEGEIAIDQFELTTQAPKTSQQEVPMPVRWIYVLKNGKWVAPMGDGRKIKISEATSSNPIIGRVAFWTDDESCKIDINSASEGIYWDTPRAATKEDFDLANYQPVQNEWQRYPGHPAMTSLSAVLAMEPFKSRSDLFYSIAPMISSSLEGSNKGTTRGQRALTLDQNRMIPLMEEMLYVGSINPVRNNAQSQLNEEWIEKLKFFMTVGNTAPETNPFDQPKISMWPISTIDSSEYRSVWDRRIADVMTVGGEPYYFQRFNSESETNDFVNISRNQKIYQYLQQKMSEKIPGYSKSFHSKYGKEESDQILTEIFDYIRCTNLFDFNLEKNLSYPTKGKQFTRGLVNANFNSSTSLNHGFGQVVPIKIGSTRGFGRFHTISEVGVQFILTSQGVAPTWTNQMQMIFLAEPFCPGLGWNGIANEFAIRVTGLNTIQITNNAINSNFTFLNPMTHFTSIRNYSVGFSNGSLIGGNGDFRTLVSTNSGFSPRYPFVSAPMTITGQPGVGTFTFQSGNITIEIYKYSYSSTSSDFQVSGSPLQSITFSFPQTTILIPSIASVAGSNTYPANGTINPNNRRQLSTADYAVNNLLNTADAFRSLAPAHGDYRLILAQSIISSSSNDFNRFEPSTDRYSQNVLLTGVPIGMRGTGALSGVGGGPFNIDLLKSKLHSSISQYFVSGTTLRNYPDLPVTTRGIGGSPLSTLYAEKYRDWDNGVGSLNDGAYINKADELSQYRPTSNSTPYFSTPHWISYPDNWKNTPNRILPSSGMLGSLSTGIKTNIPWKTLLFRPQRFHPGGDTPPDHLLMEFFQMPIVEPLGGSYALTTRGKINMNYEIFPFSYIRRTQGIRAVMKAEKIMAIPTLDGGIYKPDVGTNVIPISKKYRHFLNLSETDGSLRQFKERFEMGRYFKYPSEICEIYLTPESERWTSDDQAEAYWNNHLLTGDNTRERPYANIYPRLTTRSNKFKIYIRAQSIQSIAIKGEDDQWNEETGKILGDYRGSIIVERDFYKNFNKHPDYLDKRSERSESKVFYRLKQRQSFP